MAAEFDDPGFAGRLQALEGDSRKEARAWRHVDRQVADDSSRIVEDREVGVGAFSREVAVDPQVDGGIDAEFNTSGCNLVGGPRDELPGFFFEPEV